MQTKARRIARRNRLWCRNGPPRRPEDGVPARGVVQRLSVRAPSRIAEAINLLTLSALHRRSAFPEIPSPAGDPLLRLQAYSNQGIVIGALVVPIWLTPPVRNGCGSQ